MRDRILLGRIFVGIGVALVVFFLFIAQDISGKQTVVFVKDGGLWVKKGESKENIVVAKLPARVRSLLAPPNSKYAALLLDVPKSGLYTVDLKKKQLTLVVEEKEEKDPISDFAFSPNAAFLAYGYLGKLYLYDTSSTRTKEITKGPLPSNSLVNLTWPDAQTLYWWEFTVNQEQDPPLPISSIAKLDLSSSLSPKKRDVVLTNEKMDGIISKFIIHKNGDIYFSVGEGAASGLYSYSKGASKAELLVRWPLSPHSFALSPQASKIAFDCASQEPKLCVFNVKTKKVNEYEQSSAFDWADEETIIYVKERPKTKGIYDLWKLNTSNGKSALFISKASLFSL